MEHEKTRPIPQTSVTVLPYKELTPEEMAEDQRNQQRLTAFLGGSPWRYSEFLPDALATGRSTKMALYAAHAQADEPCNSEELKDRVIPEHAIWTLHRATFWNIQLQRQVEKRIWYSVRLLDEVPPSQPPKELPDRMLRLRLHDILRSPEDRNTLSQFLCSERAAKLVYGNPPELIQELLGPSQLQVPKDWKTKLDPEVVKGIVMETLHYLQALRVMACPVTGWDLLQLPECWKICLPSRLRKTSRLGFKTGHHRRGPVTMFRRRRSTRGFRSNTYKEVEEEPNKSDEVPNKGNKEPGPPPCQSGPPSCQPGSPPCHQRWSPASTSAFLGSVAKRM